LQGHLMQLFVLTGKIKVHSPLRLQAEIMHSYFRHSKYASFQRQLNLYGWRKLAGKGRHAPCSYFNDTVGDDLNRIMLIKVILVSVTFFSSTIHPFVLTAKIWAGRRE
jgi:HSF-type DNA-binding